jgi:glycine oxidase
MESMGDAQRVIIVGGGIIGCAVAHEFSRRGAHVTIIDAGLVGGGATRASAGVLAPYIEAHQRGTLLDLTVRSLALYDRFVAAVAEDSGLAVEFRRCGSLEITSDHAPASSRSAAQAAGAQTGVGMAWLAPEQLRSLEPSLPDSIRGALYVPSHGYVRAEQLTEALSWAAMRHGAEIETSRRVVDIRSEGDGVRVFAANNSTWTADAVVLAAGCWSGAVGVLERAALDVRPVRGQILRLGWRSTPLSHVIWGPDCYVVPWLDGTVLVGATSEDVGFDERTTAAGVRDLLDSACELIPEAWGATFLEARAGLRPATSDGLPIIGSSREVPGLFYATGHYRNGILLAPLTASLIAGLVLDDLRDPILDRVAPERFVP